MAHCSTQVVLFYHFSFHKSNKYLSATANVFTGWVLSVLVVSLTIWIVVGMITDGIVCNVLKVSLGKYGKEWDGRETLQIAGKTPFEAASAVVEDYGLPCSPIEFISEISPLFSDQ